MEWIEIGKGTALSNEHLIHKHVSLAWLPAPTILVSSLALPAQTTFVFIDLRHIIFLQFPILIGSKLQENCGYNTDLYASWLKPRFLDIIGLQDFVAVNFLDKNIHKNKISPSINFATTCRFL